MARPYEIRKIEEMTIPIWEQQTDAGETKEMYTMFLSYRNLKPAERTVMSAWRAWTKDTDAEGKGISSVFSGIAQAFLWSERAATYDIARLQDRYKVWGQRDWMLRDEVWEAGASIHKKAMKALDKIKDEELNLSLAEIAGLLTTATALREKAIPSIGTLNTNQIREVLAAMPENKRESVLRIVVAEWKQISPNEPKPQLPPPVRSPGAKLPVETAIDEIIDTPRVIVKKVYPDYIEQRLLREAIRRVDSQVSKRKLRTGLETWHEYITDTEADEIARTVRRPKGYTKRDPISEAIEMARKADTEIEMNYSATVINDEIEDSEIDNNEDNVDPVTPIPVAPKRVLTNIEVIDATA